MNRKTAALLILTLIVLLVTGCTLTGADPAPLVTVEDTSGTTGTDSGGDDGGEPATEEPLPEPTDPGPIDVFGTQTAQAMEAATEEPTEEPTETPEPTEEATEAPTEEPTESQEPTEAPTDDAGGGSNEACTHVVQPGQNLFRIALQYGVTVEQLAAANGITNVAVVGAGTTLSIPGCSGGGDKLTETDDGGDGSAGDGGEGNTGGQTHVVQPDENLFRIALQYNLTVEALAAANGITNPNAIVVGQVLQIPSGN